MPSLRVCIDVDDLDRAIAFYTRAFGLRVKRRFESSFAELEGAGTPIDLLAKASGSAPFPAPEATRDYRRHWTPVHVDVVVEELEAALARAREAGAVLEGEVVTRPFGRMANLADPFGHGFCLIQFAGRGYGEVVGD
jgi:predicted enzyme related to lactoylglutathione lyase